MHIPDCSKDATDVAYTGGFSDVTQCRYEGHRVAVKVLNVHTVNLNAVLSVSEFLFTSSHSPVWKYIIGILQRGSCLETPPTSEHLTAAGGYAQLQRVCHGFRVDGQR